MQHTCFSCYFHPYKCSNSFFQCFPYHWVVCKGDVRGGKQCLVPASPMIYAKQCGLVGKYCNFHRYQKQHPVLMCATPLSSGNFCFTHSPRDIHLAVVPVVPQGSTLNSLLFTIVINGTTEEVKKCEILLHADGTILQHHTVVYN